MRTKRAREVILVALALLVTSCQTEIPSDFLSKMLFPPRITPADFPVSADSSILGVEVDFPFDWIPDPPLYRVEFLREAEAGGFGEPLELLRSSWVQESRAYLLNPEQGAYRVATVSYWSEGKNPPLVTVILPPSLIAQTRITVAGDSLAFAGALRVTHRPWADKITAETEFEDELQKRLVERIDPDAATRTGFLAVWRKLVYLTSPSASTMGDRAQDRDPFARHAREDFADFPQWAEFARTHEPNDLR